MKFKITLKQQLLLILPFLIIKERDSIWNYYYYFGFEFPPSFYTYILLFIITIRYFAHHISTHPIFTRKTKEKCYHSAY